MKTLKNLLLPILALAGGIAVLFLRQSHIATLDNSGILATGHIPGILAGVLSCLIPALLLWRSLVLPKNSVCRFPASIVAAVGYGIGALGIAFTAVDILKNQPDTWLLILGIAGVVAALALGVLAGVRWLGRKGHILLHLAVFAFLALLLFNEFRKYSTCPQLPLFFHSLLALMALVIGVYQRASCEEGMGHPKSYLFFRSLCVFFCLAAIPGAALWPLYIAGSIWSLADLWNLSVTEQEGEA